MKTTMIPVTAETVANSEAGAYNQAEWKKKVTRFAALQGVFFQVENEERFFVKYVADGLMFFSEVTMYSVLSSTGFTRVILLPTEDGRFTVTHKGFGEDGKSRVVNTKAGREWLAFNICRYGIPVTNE